ncbi:alpha/beta hydrolase [Colwellia hornerae]|uniref:Alpha/beta hydrolase n=1 Tax=Colwellia hornerae TaxID=89402 RepID=A0A5C6QP78_9GAMM|nr:alpha/beta hydrolase [Colwellia hornerae]TWX56248.1 alpha/beta hydrolase [Colwellia hornerae]TWX62099.1 alpha/beta hydrolase [Colwellia hornerae]TWX70501.1 alpha/beta hydrolase [Colwellia hornerae]
MNIVHIILAILVFSMSLNTKAESCISVEVKGAGQPLILIPGLMSDGSVWQSSEKYLAKTYQVHTVSIAGFAKTKPCAGANNIMPRVKIELLSYIKQHKLLKPILLGHSLGAFLSYSLAIENEALFSAIIAVDGLPYIAPIFTRTSLTKPKDMQQQAQFLRNIYQQATAQEMADMTKQNIAIQATSREDQQAVIAMARISDQKTVASALYFLLLNDLREPLKKLKTPLLLIAAQGAFQDDSSRQFATSLYQQQIENVANAHLIINTDARHFIMWDDTKWLMAQTDLFLQGIL